MQSINIHQQEIATQVQHAWAISSKAKSIIRWFVLMTVVAAAFTYLFAISIDDMQVLYKYAFALFFLLAGIPHILIFLKWMPLAQSGKRFFYTLLLSIMIAATVFTVHSMVSVSDVSVAAAAGFGFLLPVMVQLCWYYFSGIQQPENAWYLPKDMLPETRMSLLLLNSMPVTIQIGSAKNSKPLPYPTAFNAKLNLSVIFCRFLYDRQDALQATGENGEPAGWYFFVQRWYGLKTIDANKTLEKNGVRENDTIIIERA
ncbi:MAG: TssN family type VI secretion system protein [Bacteroidota bacterium]